MAPGRHGGGGGLRQPGMAGQCGAQATTSIGRPATALVTCSSGARWATATPSSCSGKRWPGWPPENLACGQAVDAALRAHKRGHRHTLRAPNAGVTPMAGSASDLSVGRGTPNAT
jgi:hypothetical protein